MERRRDRSSRTEDSLRKLVSVSSGSTSAHGRYKIILMTAGKNLEATIVMLSVTACDVISTDGD